MSGVQGGWRCPGNGFSGRGRASLGTLSLRGLGSGTEMTGLIALSPMDTLLSSREPMLAPA